MRVRPQLEQNGRLTRLCKWSLVCMEALVWWSAPAGHRMANWPSRPNYAAVRALSVATGRKERRVLGWWSRGFAGSFPGLAAVSRNRGRLAPLAEIEWLQ